MTTNNTDQQEVRQRKQYLRQRKQCSRCFRAFTAGPEDSLCPLCDADEQAHAEWERDNFGDN